MARTYRSQRVAPGFPADVPTPFFRFDGQALSGSDGSAVSSISDAGGGGLTLTQANAGQRPSLVLSQRGFKALRFTKANATELSSATGGITGAGAHTMLAVSYTRTADSAFAPIVSVGPNGGFTSALGLGFATDTSIWGGASSLGTPAFSGATLRRPQMSLKVYDSSAASVYLNAARMGLPVTQAYTVSSAAFGLGTPWTGAARCPDVDVFAAAWWNVALTGAQISAAYRYFARLYGLSMPQRIIYRGDSIAAGIGATDLAHRPNALLQALLARPTSVANSGTGSIQLATLVTASQFQADVMAKLTSGPPPIVVCHAGTNDMMPAATGYDATAAQVLALQAQDYTLLKAAGCKVVLHTILKRIAGSFETRRQTINTAYLDPSAIGLYADAVVNLDADAGLADNTSDSYIGDATHPSNKGNAAMAALDAAVIPSLI